MSDRAIIARAREFYTAVAARYEADRYYERFPLNAFWGRENMATMRGIIAGAEGGAAAVHRTQQTLIFSVNVAAPVKERAVDWLVAEQRSRGVDLAALPPEVQESACSFPGNNVLREGRRLTPDFMRTVSIGLQIGRYFKSGAGMLDVVELGGGMGHLARTLRLLGCARSHLIIDLPETLFFSFCFLSLNFPEARMALVQDEESARRIAASDYDFAFVPSLYADAALLRSYDLFVNTASLGEMRNEVIRYWMEFVQARLSVRNIYTLNRFLNTIDPRLHAWRWNENECSVHYDRRWDILQWELEPSFTRCPYVDTSIARYVEIAAARRPAADEAACRHRAAALLAEVQEEDWYRIEGDSAVMTRGDHVLAHDLGRSGTLFKLWEALRMQPTAQAFAALIQYLATLLGRDDREFEEQRYYEKRFLELAESSEDPALAAFANVVRQGRYHSKRRRIELIASHGNYNLVRADDRIIAISRALGDVRLFDERLGEREIPPILFVARSVEEASNRIDSEVRSEKRRKGELIASRGGYNFVRAHDLVIAVSQSIGPIRPFDEHLGERDLPPVLFVGQSLEEVSSKVENEEASSAAHWPRAAGGAGPKS